MTPTLAELAEDATVFLEVGRGVERLDRGDLHLYVTGNRCAVHRVRLRDVEGAIAWARAEAARRRARRLEWWVGPSATPADVEARLVAAGLVPDDQEAVLTGMTCDEPPPSAPHVDVRRVETIEQQLEAIRVDWEVWGHGEHAARAGTERARFDPDGPVQHFAAYADGRPVGFGRAIDMRGGVALMGGAVLPEHRGRGVYRALVRARWDHAVGRGTPLLVVQAGRMSAPVLDGLGFRRHVELHLYMDPGVASGHGDN